MPKVFISRELAPDSILLTKLQVAGYEVFGKSFVQFSAILFTSVPESDWIFFYSKKAVQFFFENIQQKGISIQAKLAALGEGTARALEKRELPIDFIGSGNPQESSAAFLQIAKNQRVLFPRASNSRQSIQQLLENQIIAIDLIVYKNEARTDFDLPMCDWLVFTSPLNAQAYFGKYVLKPNQQVLAIGETTAGALQQLGIKKIKIAESPSEEALAALILSA